jgi:hypothetical protein
MSMGAAVNAVGTKGKVAQKIRIAVKITLYCF